MPQRSGFTLFEMGIVLTIIALISGAVLVGKEMITAAELRTITNEQSMYVSAYKEFIDKYQAIPGDMSNATSVWGTDSVCPTVTTNTIPKVATCNGDGSGTIGDFTNGAYVAANPRYEVFRAWQHLSNAGLIEGKFTGAMGSTSSTTNIGVNVPRSKTGKAGWTLLWMNSTTDNNYFFSATLVEYLASHTLVYGAQTSGSFTDTGILAPIDAKNIDQKLDDGMPHTGNIRSKRADATTCGVSSATTSDYNVTSNTLACQLMFMMGL